MNQVSPYLRPECRSINAAMRDLAARIGSLPPNHPDYDRLTAMLANLGKAAQ